MILMLHLVAAAGSMMAATVALMSPTKARLHVAYALTGAMTSSGVYLVVLNTAHLLKACVMGLGFLTVVGVQLAAARKKLA